MSLLLCGSAGRLVGRLPLEVAAAGGDAPVTMCGSAAVWVTRSDQFGEVASTSRQEGISRSAIRTADAARAAEGEDGRDLVKQENKKQNK